MKLQSRNTSRFAQLALLAALMVPAIAFAGGTGMPWEGWLDQILNSITGPVARAIGVIAIVACGLGIAFSEGGGGMRKLLMVCLGLCIAFTAASFFLGFLGYGGGAVF